MSNESNDSDFLDNNTSCVDLWRTRKPACVRYDRWTVQAIAIVMALAFSSSQT